MADKDDNQPDNKELREKLEAALAENKDLKSSVQTLQAQTLMPTLNDRQRRVVMRELAEDKLDINTENVAQVAEDLGYNLTPDPPPNADNSNNSGNGNNNQNDNQPPDEEENREIMVSLTEMNAMDRAQYNASRGNLAPDLETKMREAKTPEALRNIIRTQGGGSGLVHEWDES